MRCGTVMDATGRIKQTWAIVSGECAVPVEIGDEVVEWTVDHGETEPVAAKITEAIQHQQQLRQARRRGDVLALSAPHQTTRTMIRADATRGVQDPNDTQDYMYRSDGQLASRAKGTTDFPVLQCHGILAVRLSPDAKEAE